MKTFLIANLEDTEKFIISMLKIKQQQELDNK
jgi:hypothetical protein